MSGAEGPGRCALITGAANGIGADTARPGTPRHTGGAPGMLDRLAPIDGAHLDGLAHALERH